MPAARRLGGVLAGWPGLRRFWIGVLAALAIGAGVLQALGPPPGPPNPAIAQRTPAKSLASGPGPTAKPPVASQPTQLQAAQQTSRPPPVGRATPGPVADPDPSLLEADPGDPNHKLPRVSANGRAPMAAYAAGFDPTNVRPRVGMLIAGIGMSETDSLAAIKTLPGGVTLAISPYGGNLEHLLAAARLNEHEYLVSVPMEPNGYPVNDPDDRRALMTSLPSSENLTRLNWVLSRLTGYVGVTDAFGQMHGDRLAGVPDQFTPVLEDVAHRGLLFVDARPGQPALPYAWSRSVDVVIDTDPVDAKLLDQRLNQLTQTALDKGSALGLVQVPRPVTLARVAAWTNTLAAKGLALAPVSTLVVRPAKQEAEK
ncbi:divergent polysaccharide deacetylase family protein [Rhodopila sp.]|uniref:divergent polysaccharide deacetylase family protein n=1 Tax=Rhodopila sp. TaxID=2480087 RepID=UPI003D1397F4